MFKVNILNISLWTLMGLLALILIGVVIWRLFFDSKKQELQDKQLQGLTKTDFGILNSIFATQDIKFGYNILIKNKFAKDNKFSFIPSLVFKNSNAYIILPSKTIKKETVFSQQGNFLVNNKSIYKINLRQIKDINKLLKTFNIYPKIIVPIFGDLKNLKNQQKDLNIIFVETQQLEDFLQSPKKGQVNFSDFEKVIKLNVFKKFNNKGFNDAI